MMHISAVSYLNTKPFLHGLDSFDHPDFELDITLHTPSKCAQKLIDGQIDIGLVPIASVPLIKGAKVFGSHCIGSNGAVKTVALFSNEPLQECDTVYLDYQSMTSVLLTQYLMKYHWKLKPVYVSAEPGYENRIQHKEAALIIGDRTIDQFHRFQYVYDLSQAWYDLTQKPFAFAVWVSNKELSSSFIQAFDLALQRGVDQKESLASLYEDQFPSFSVHSYYTKYLDYHFGSLKKESMNQLLAFMQSHQKSK